MGATPELTDPSAATVVVGNTDVIGLYVNPPDHAAVFAVDEKTAIQALDRLDPVLPLSPGRAERHGFEYYRHGTLSLFAALNTQTGEVVGQTVPRHTSAAFVDFLSEVVAGAIPEGERVAPSPGLGRGRGRAPSRGFEESFSGARPITQKWRGPRF